MQVVAKVLDQRQVVVENGQVQWVDHGNVHTVRQDALLPEHVDLVFANLFAQDFLANFLELVDVEPSWQIIEVVLQHDLVYLGVASRLEKLAELGHPRGAAVGQDLEAHELVIHLFFELLRLCLQELDQLRAPLLAVSPDVLDEKLDVLLEEGSDLDQLEIVLELLLHGRLVWLVVVLLDAHVEGQPYVLELRLAQLLLHDVSLL